MPESTSTDIDITAKTGAGTAPGRQARKPAEQGWDVKSVKQRTGRPSEHWFYLPAFLLVGLVWFTQGRRMKAAA